MSGILFVISAPSGTGKSTAAARLLEAIPDLEFSVSYTTRVPRAGEADGREYHFVDRPSFEGMVERGEFLEWASVFGECYGTGLEVTRAALAAGRDLLLDVDVSGAGQVKRSPVPSVSIMILPPDYETLRRRLSGRASEGEEARTRRLARAREEAEQAEQAGEHVSHYDYVVVNGDLETCVGDLIAIVRAERRRTARCGAELRRILETFPKSPANGAGAPTDD